MIYMEKISVIVPVYNAEQYIRRCIESIRNQTHENIEIILVDDGSTDNSGKICEEYVELDSRIQVIHQENKGLVLARKTGIEYATGKFLGFVDADDYIEPKFFEILFSYIIKKNVDFVHSGYVEEYKKIHKERKVSCEYTYTEKDNKINLIQENILVQGIGAQTITHSIWSKLFRTSFIKKCYMQVPDNVSLGEDLLALCYCVCESNNFTVISYAGYHYEIYENSMSHSAEINNILKESILYAGLQQAFIKYGYFQQLKSCLESFFKLQIFKRINQIESYGLELPIYLYPDIDVLKGEKIILYGAGEVGNSYYSQFLKNGTCKVVAWVDKKYNSCEDNLHRGIGTALELEYDYIIIAVKDKIIAQEIEFDLLKMRVDKDKIIWKKPMMND